MNKRKLNILLLSGVNPLDNAGISVYDMFRSLQQAGHSVLLLTKDYDDRFEPGMESVCGKKNWIYPVCQIFSGNFPYKLFRKIQSLLKGKIKMDLSYYMYSLDERKNHISTPILTSHIQKKIDAIIYCFPHFFLDSKNIYELNQITQAPVFVIPPDMSSFTGGCHYANDCRRFEHTCGKCPGLYSKDERDITYRNLMYKKRYISKTNICILGNKWTIDLSKKSFLYKDKPNSLINFVINENHYKLTGKDDARYYFSIPTDKKIIFFGAAFIDEKRKGFSFLLDALNILYKELPEMERTKIGIAIAGNLNEDIRHLFQFDTYILGYLSNEQLPKAYQSADVFVSPSIQDAGPMMVIQSMMCGTPVVAFEMGNAIDYIIDGVTGFKVPLCDIISLKDKILRVLKSSNEKKAQMSINCRKIAKEKSSYKAFERDFFSNYQSIVKYKTNF